MHCHVLVSGLSWRQGDPREACEGLELGALETLLAKGRRAHAPARMPEQWLMERYGVERQRDWPVAPFSLLGDGGVPGTGAWMRADPVHLRIEQNQMVLADHNAFRVTREEAEALAEAINAHLGDRLVVHPLRTGRWYARLPDCPDIETIPLRAARGRAVDALLPRGPESMAWHALANELQMLLHAHPVNTAREDKGEHPINGVWFWGAGRLAPPAGRPFQHVAADDPLSRGLAQASGAEARELPPGAQAWLADAGDTGVALVALDALACASDYGDAGAWREALMGLEQAWYAPLLRALAAGRIGMLTLHLLDEAHSLEVEVSRSDLRHFWRRRKPIGHWLA